MLIKGPRTRVEEFLSEVMNALPKFDGVSYEPNTAYSPCIIIRYKEEKIDKITFSFYDISIDIDKMIEHLNKRIPTLIKRHKNLLTKEEVDKEKKAFAEVVKFLEESCIPVKSNSPAFSKHYKIPETKIHIHYRLVNWVNAYNEIGKPKHQSTVTRCFKISRSVTVPYIYGHDSGFKPSKFKSQLKKALNK